MTAESVALGVLLVSLCGATVTALIIGGRWIERRACRHEYADETLPSAAEVARVQADNDAAAELDEVIEELRELGIRVNA